MNFYHLNCGGDIDTIHRKCLKCGKTWNFITILTNTEMRVVPKSITNSTADVPWYLDKDKFVSKLPKWPRWLRLLTVVAIILAIVAFIVLLRGG